MAPPKLLSWPRGGLDHGAEHRPNWQEITAENRRQGQTLPLRQVPKAKSKARQDPCPVVLSELLAVSHRRGVFGGERADMRLLA